MDRSPHLEVCVRVCERECVKNVLGTVLSCKYICVMTSSNLSVLGCHDVNDGNAAGTLRLCTFMFSTWPRCCLPSVRVNSCHTKKSHINSKRHNKLIFVKLLGFIFIPLKMNFNGLKFPLRKHNIKYAVV